MKTPRLLRCGMCSGKPATGPCHHKGRTYTTVYCSASSYHPAVTRRTPYLATLAWNALALQLRKAQRPAGGPGRCY